MRRSCTSPIFVCLCAVLFGCFALPSAVSAIEIQIDVAPNVLNIQSESTVVTVHTDIAYNLVEGSSVFLNGVSISYGKSDNRGNFVAKFLASDIKTLEGLVIGGYNTLVLMGYTIDGEAFIGQQEIMVIDIQSNGN